MARKVLSENVFEMAVRRMTELYEGGHRVVVSFSGGKDSGVCLEVAIIAAHKTGCLPVEVIMRDEEVMFPGTFEYSERVAARDDVKFHWLVAGQPVTNVYDRESPYFWVFDDRLSPDEWMRTPPDWATRIPEQNITGTCTLDRFPPPEGKKLYCVMGLRASESMARLMGLHMSKSHIAKHPMKTGAYTVRPIYDWSDGDVWKAHFDLGWDYNKAYDDMNRLGIPRSQLRIAPPTLNAHGVESLALASQAWPEWFDRLGIRLRGVRQAGLFGKQVVMPHRRHNETWEECYNRECIQEAPKWIADRSIELRDKMTFRHAKHATTSLPEIKACQSCERAIGSWRTLARIMYCGDPMSLRQGSLKYIEPEFFREGAGVWGGDPAFS